MPISCSAPALHFLAQLATRSPGEKTPILLHKTSLRQIPLLTLYPGLLTKPFPSTHTSYHPLTAHAAISALRALVTCALRSGNMDSSKVWLWVAIACFEKTAMTGSIAHVSLMEKSTNTTPYSRLHLNFYISKLFLLASFLFSLSIVHVVAVKLQTSM